MTCVCSVAGYDRGTGITPYTTIAAIIADEAAIGGSTTRPPRFGSYRSGKNVGDWGFRRPSWKGDGYAGQFVLIRRLYRKGRRIPAPLERVEKLKAVRHDTQGIGVTGRPLRERQGSALSYPKSLTEKSDLRIPCRSTKGWISEPRNRPQRRWTGFRII